jgi:hypothetical protein
MLLVARKETSGTSCFPQVPPQLQQQGCLERRAAIGAIELGPGSREPAFTHSVRLSSLGFSRDIKGCTRVILSQRKKEGSAP